MCNVERDSRSVNLVLKHSNEDGHVTQASMKRTATRRRTSFGWGVARMRMRARWLVEASAWPVQSEPPANGISRKDTTGPFQLRKLRGNTSAAERLRVTMERYSVGPAQRARPRA